jgi:crotonobetainyl-CoA:carnitine CoA-transferase CaiB-like acyl-CoA transferase
MSATPGSVSFPGRPLGADTDEVLGSIGVSEERIRELRERGVVA